VSLNTYNGAQANDPANDYVDFRPRLAGKVWFFAEKLQKTIETEEAGILCVILRLSCSGSGLTQKNRTTEFLLPSFSHFPKLSNQI
jgi:hypothetical protein